jgi:hypothetical protein
MEACFDKMLAMVTSLRHLLGWIVSAFSSRGTLFSKISLSASNCSPCTPNDLAVD